MLKRFLGIPLLTLLAFSLIIIGCENEDPITEVDDLTVQTRIDEVPLGKEGQKYGSMLRAEKCFKFVFPITIVYPNSETESVESNKELLKALALWFRSNRGAIEFPTFEFPLTVVLEDESTVELLDEDELIALKESCEGKRPRPKLRPALGKCYDLVFPVTVVFPDSTTAEAADQDELKALFQQWKLDNPDASGRPRLQFPYTVVDKDGNETIVNGPEDLRLLAKDCLKKKRPRPSLRPWFGLGDCYDLVFPVTVVFPDSTTAEATDQDELKALIQQWKIDNPDANGRPHLQFPFTVVNEDGVEIVVEGPIMLKRLLKKCKTKKRPKPKPGNGLKDCYDLVFPVTVVFPDSTTADAVDQDELKSLFQQWKTDNPDATERPQLQFPYTVVDEDGNETVVNNREELKLLIKDCVRSKGNNRPGNGGGSGGNGNGGGNGRP